MILAPTESIGQEKTRLGNINEKNHFWGLQGASNAIYSDRGCMVAKRVNRAALEIRKIDRIQ